MGLESFPTGLEHGLQFAAGEMGREHVVERVDEPKPGDCAFDEKIARRSRPYDQLPWRIDADDFAILLEFERRQLAAREAGTQAVVVEQIAGMLRPAVHVEIGRRGGCCEALNSRTDRQGNHVLLKSFVIANAGIGAGGE